MLLSDHFIEHLVSLHLLYHSNQRVQYSYEESKHFDCNFFLWVYSYEESKHFDCVISSCELLCVVVYKAISKKIKQADNHQDYMWAQ